MLIYCVERGDVMRRYDYSFLNDGLIPTNLLSITAEIYTLRFSAQSRKSQFLQVFSELETVAKVASVKSSNAIEGIITSDERIREIVNGSSAPLNHNEQEIAGYRDALTVIHLSHNYYDFDEKSIKALHSTMLSIAGYPYAGHYKDVNNNIIEEDINGNRKVRFSPVPADDTPAAMEQLILAYQVARDDPNVNQLLLIPCVILDFLCIHPFRDGNGRISRLLSLLLLYKNGFDVGKYISFEEQINQRKGNYYEALRKSSQGWHDNQNDYSAFIMEFLITLYMCYKELDRRFAVIGDKKINKQTRVEATVLNSLLPISKSEILKILPDVSQRTVELVLSQMVRENAVKKVGTGKNTKYIRN